jgi:CheY-like chemotaxis protein
MIYRLGVRGRRIYDEVRGRIDSGDLAVGAQVPSLRELAETFGVAPVTVRHALSVLEDEGFVSREQGRGTFVRRPRRIAVLVVDDEAAGRRLLRRVVQDAGFRVVEADGPAAALQELVEDRDIGLVFSDVRMPNATDGIGFIRAVRRRWPKLPLAAVTGFAEDLEVLHGTRECPVLILRKPVRAAQVEEALYLAAPKPTSSSAHRPTPGPVLVAAETAAPRRRLRDAITALGHEVAEAAGTELALSALAGRPFGHVFVDLRDAGEGQAFARTVADQNPQAVVVLCTQREPGGRAGAPVVVLDKPVRAAALEQTLRMRRVPAAAS